MAQEYFNTSQDEHNFFLAALTFHPDLRAILEKEGVFIEVVNEWIRHTTEMQKTLEERLVSPYMEIPIKTTEFTMDHTMLKICRLVHFGKEYKL